MPIRFRISTSTIFCKACLLKDSGLLLPKSKPVFIFLGWLDCYAGKNISGTRKFQTDPCAANTQNKQNKS